MRITLSGCASRALLLLWLAPLAPACEQAEPPEPPAPPVVTDATPDTLRDQALAFVEQYYADFSARDWVRYADHFWPGATLTTVWQPPGEPAARVVTTSIEEFTAQAPAGPGSRQIFEERMTSAQVRASGDLAQVWASYEARFGDPGDIQEWTGVDAFTLMRFEGRWRIVSLAYSNDENGPR